MVSTMDIRPQVRPYTGTVDHDLPLYWADLLMGNPASGHFVRCGKDLVVISTLGRGDVGENGDSLPTKMDMILLDLYCLAVVAVVEVLGHLPSPRLRGLGMDFLARVAYAVSRRKRRRIEENLDLAFGAELDAARKRHLAVACFREFWQEMVQWVPSTAPDLPVDCVQMQGIKHLEDALARGKGVILWESNGFGRRVLAKRVLHARGFPVYQLHGVTHMGVIMTDIGAGTWLRKRVLRPLFERRERSFVADILLIPLASSMTASRAYLDRLRDNGILCVPGDGLIARKLYALNFLGGTTMFAPGMVKLARLSGATILPMFCVPTGERNAVLEIGPPIVLERSGDRDEIVEHSLRQFAGALEAQIRRRPECFRNWHLVGFAASARGANRARECVQQGDPE